jgi:murein L,D-transpeptidase YcbB/YkuD
VRRAVLISHLLLAGPVGVQAQDTVAAIIRPLVSAARLPAARWPDFARYRDVVSRLYQMGAGRPIWLDSNGVVPQAGGAIAALRTAPEHGLDPGDYDAEMLDRWLIHSRAGHPDPEGLARFDLLLSVDLLRFLDDLQTGRLHRGPLGRSELPGPDLRLADAVSHGLGADSLRRVISAVIPHLAQYQNLQRLLSSYRALAADSTLDSVPGNAPLRPGAEYPGVTALRRRLIATGDLPADSVISGEDRYGAVEVQAVQRFQRRHGLTPDGVLDGATLATINTPFQQRVRQIELALERLRWLPSLQGRRFVVVNIPAFQLFAFDSAGGSGMPSLSMKVIVGKALDTRTPMLLQDMRYVEFRPYWNVPRSIVMAEIVPALRRNPRYLTQNDMELVGPGDRVVGSLVTAELVDQLRSGQLRVRQRPGSENALGLIKFAFPNSASVYLHGTPRTELFSHSRRDFSHGCIRVEDPTALAEWVLRDQPGWNGEVIQAVQRGRATVRAWLSRPLPVIVFYTTAVAAPGGNAWFYSDIYGHDRALDDALKASPVSP